MAIAYSIVERHPASGRVVVDITLDTAYGAGGYALDGKACGLLTTAPRNVSPTNYRHATATSSNVAQWNSSTNKLLVFEAGTAAGPMPECIAADITASHVVRANVYGDVAL